LKDTTTGRYSSIALPEVVPLASMISSPPPVLSTPALAVKRYSSLVVPLPGT